MTTTFPPLASAVHLPTRRSVEPAPVRVECHYCVEAFEPTRDPQDGSLWDLDDHDKHCCNDCHCPSCMTGHFPNQNCPAALEPADEIADREEAAVYGDPDGAYDALCDARADTE